MAITNDEKKHDAYKYKEALPNAIGTVFGIVFVGLGNHYKINILIDISPPVTIIFSIIFSYIITIIIVSSNKKILNRIKTDISKNLENKKIPQSDKKNHISRISEIDSKLMENELSLYISISEKTDIHN